MHDEQPHTEAIRAELQRHQQLLKLVTDALPALVSYIGTDHRYKLVNRTYEEWYGTPSEQLVGRLLREVIGDAAYVAITPHLERVFAGHKVQYEAKLDLRLRGARVVRASYHPDFAVDGSVRGFLAVAYDITEQKQSEQRIQEETRTNEVQARLGALLVADLDLEGIFRRLTDEATVLCRAQFGAFFYNVTDDAGQSMMLYTVSGVPREAFSKFPQPRKTAIFAPTLNGESIVRSDDITKDARYGQNPPHHGMPEGHLPVRSYLAVPVVSRSGHVHGALLFGHEAPAMFTERDELAMVAVAAQAAVAIDNAQLHAVSEAAQRKYRALAESMPLLVWTALPNGSLEYANESFLQYTGLTLAALREGERDSSIVHPSDAARFNAVWGASVRTGQPFEMEYRLRRADGRHRWFLVRGVPVSNEQGAVTRWVGSSTDIDDRKRNEETARFVAEAGALLASSSRDSFATLSKLAKLAVPTLADVCVIDILGEAGVAHTIASSAVEAEQWLTGSAFLQGQTRLKRSELVRHVIETGQTVASDAEPSDAPAQEETLAWLVVPMQGQQRIMGAITFASFQPSFQFELRDRGAAEDLGRRAGNLVENARLYDLALEERRRAEDASRAKDLFMSTLSHELRTPLSAILGWTRMLQSGKLAPDKQEKALATIERNARVQATMIEDVLDLARIASGKLRLDVAPVEMPSVVEAAIDTIRPTADAKGVRVQSVLDSDTGILHGDGPRLQQVVWNLLSNAVKFTPKGGRIYVMLRKVDSAVEIVISDTGIGIATDFIPHVFERFTQADSSRTRRHGGLGLGLSIVKHITELHGGSVSADSQGTGSGATFTVRLPVAPVRETPVPLRSDTTQALSAKLSCPVELNGLRVLVVDDEADARELVQSVLETCNVKVSLARSAAEAFEKVRSERPNVLVSDIGMPDEDGYSLIRRIRALPKEEGGATPAIALTAYAHMTDRTRALMEGFHNHVSKPAEPQELIAVVAALAGRG